LGIGLLIILILKWARGTILTLKVLILWKGLGYINKIGEANNLLNSKCGALFDSSSQLTIQIKDEITEVNFQINDLKKMYQDEFHKSRNSEDDDINWDGLLQILNLRFAALSQRFTEYLTARSKTIEKQEETKSRLNFIDDKNKISNRRVTSFKNFGQNGKRSRIFDDNFDMEEEGLMNENGEERKQKFDQIEMIENRSKDLENIKEVLAEINQMFTKFSEIVNTQQLMVERIDTDTEMALINVEKGKKELSEHYQNVSSYRNLIFKIFLILIIFATLYIIFVV